MKLCCFGIEISLNEPYYALFTYFVIETSGSFISAKPDIDEMIRLLEAEPGVSDCFGWYKEYVEHLAESNVSFPTTGPALVSDVQTFLNTAAGSQFRSDIVFDGENNILRSKVAHDQCTNL